MRRIIAILVLAILSGVYVIQAHASEEQQIMGGVLAKLSTSESEGNPSILLAAIEEAHAKGTYVRIPAGCFVFPVGINLPTGYSVQLIGEGDAYASSMNRETVTSGDTTEKHPMHQGSCFIYRGTSCLFNNSGNVILSMQNMMLLNEKADKSYIRQGRVFGQGMVKHSTKGKVYMQNCCIAGFGNAFGNISSSSPDNDELSCVVADRVRWCFCAAAVVDNVDGRITDCSVNKCTDGFVFHGNSGFTTISNCRIEWIEKVGILSDSRNLHDVTISNIEFDRCGEEAIRMTGGKHVTITGCMFRRSGCNVSDDLSAETEKSHHLTLSNVSDVVLTSNNTCKKNSLDNGKGTQKPYFSYLITNCDNITNIGNNWNGAVKPLSTDTTAN